MRGTAFTIFALLAASSALAQQPGDADASALDWIQVTATRFADPVQEVPNAITVISGEDLRAQRQIVRKGEIARHRDQPGQGLIGAQAMTAGEMFERGGRRLVGCAHQARPNKPRGFQSRIAMVSA